MPWLRPFRDIRERVGWGILTSSPLSFLMGMMIYLSFLKGGGLLVLVRVQRR
jgi:hypothetical protein